MSRRVFVLADLHLTRATPRAITRALAAFVAAHASSRIIVAGDLFDLSAESPKPTVREVLYAHPHVREALRAHLDDGGELWLAAGNHDRDVGADGFASELADMLEITRDAHPRLRTSPWFFRDGALHVEHGHHYDPDNASAHPLVVGSPSLGVHFVESFIAQTGAHAYLNANDGTPLELFAASFRWYGRRAPYIVYRFFHVAFSSLARSGPFYRARCEVTLGRARSAAFADAFDVTPAMVDALVDLGARPTLESFPGTFARLYLDRVAATVALLAGLLFMAFGHFVAGAVALGAGVVVMASSWAFGHDRYRGSVGDRLAESAGRIAATSSAGLVVFGHLHREAVGGGYANTGSFSFPRGAPGRPYLEVVQSDGAEGAPTAVRKYWGATLPNGPHHATEPAVTR